MTVLELMLREPVERSLWTLSTSPLSAASWSSVLSSGALQKTLVIVHPNLLGRYMYPVCLSGAFFIGQEAMWVSNSRTIPFHWHPLSTWAQNTPRLRTLCWNSSSISVSHCDALHSGHFPLSSFILTTANSDRGCFLQQDVRWGCTSRPNVTGQ